MIYIHTRKLHIALQSGLEAADEQLARLWIWGLQFTMTSNDDNRQ
jgi:hypothetical protein